MLGPCCPGLAGAEGVCMLQKGTAKKVTIFVNEDTQHHFISLCDSILTFLLHKGCLLYTSRCV